MVYIVLPPELSKRSIQTLVQYMYSGEATVSNDILNEVLRGGELLKIRGLWRNHPSGEPPNAIPHYQPDAQASLPPPSQTSSILSNTSTPSNKIGSSDLVYQSSAAIDRVSCSLNTGPLPPSVVKESPLLTAMSPRHASHPPSQLTINHHHHNGSVGSAGQIAGGVQNQIKRELEYPPEPPSPPHHEMSSSMFNVRKLSVSSGVVSSGGEIISSRCKAPVIQMEYVQENGGRDRRYVDEHHRAQDRHPSIESHQQPHLHMHSSSQQPAPARLILRDTEVLRMSECQSESMNERRSSFHQIDSQQQPQHIHHQHQAQPVDNHHHMEQSDRHITTASDRISSATNPNHQHHRVKVTSTTMSSVEPHPIKMKSRDLTNHQQLPTETMGFLTIKQEPLEWSEITSDNGGSAAAALLLDSKAHIEVTVKPELIYPENEDSCEVPAGK